MARKRRDIHRPHRKHEPQPFTLLTVWHALWAMTGDGGSPVTALDVARWIRRDLPHSTAGRSVTHNDVNTVRGILAVLIKNSVAECCAERPATPTGGRRARQYVALRAPDGTPANASASAAERSL